MIWATWRQHRATLVSALSLLGLLIVVNAISAVILRPHGQFLMIGDSSACYSGDTLACNAQSVIEFTLLLSVALPVLLGVFVGVTVFARDISHGTHVLGLSQSVSRARWFWSKLLVVFVPIVLAATLLGATLQWARRYGILGNYSYGSSLETPFFESSALALGATTTFALILGAAVALVVNRSLASMAVTVVISVVALIAIGHFARPHYATPDIDAQPLDHGMTYYSLGPTGDNQRLWTVGNGYVDANGRAVDIDLRPCDAQYEWADYPEPSPDESATAFDERSTAWNDAQMAEQVDCIKAQGASHYQVKYHRESQFWRFQLTEAAIMLLLAGALLIPARWGLRRLRP